MSDKRLRPTVRLVTKGEGSRKSGKFKLSFASALANAKKVISNRVDPIMDNLEEQGVIPTFKSDELRNVIESKMLSFNRKNDNEWMPGFDKAYSQFRTDCWKKAVKKESLDDIPKVFEVSGRANAIPDCLIVEDDSYMRLMPIDVDIRLPGHIYSSVNKSLLEEVLIKSNIIKGTKMDNRDILPGPCNADANVFVPDDEREILRYLYSHFLQACRISKGNWVKALLEIMTYKGIYSIRSKPLLLYDNREIPKGCVPFEIEGYVITPTIDEVVDCIESCRDDEKTYHIGEVESLTVFYYKLLLHKEFGVEMENMTQMRESHITESESAPETLPTKDKWDKLPPFPILRLIARLDEEEWDLVKNTQDLYPPHAHECAMAIDSMGAFDKHSLRLLLPPEEREKAVLDLLEEEKELTENLKNLRVSIGLPAEKTHVGGLEIIRNLDSQSEDGSFDGFDFDEFASLETEEPIPDNILPEVDRQGVDLQDPADRSQAIPGDLRRLAIVWDPGGFIASGSFRMTGWNRNS